MIVWVLIIMYHNSFYSIIARGNPDRIKMKVVSILYKFTLEINDFLIIMKMVKVNNK